MAEPFIGEIRVFTGNFAPRGWAFCDGQLLAISQNDTLFSLLGTIYGGDGMTTFGLPDLRGRIPVHPGNGIILGQKGGEEEVTVTANQLPSHSHPLQATASIGSLSDPTNNLTSESPSIQLYREIAPNAALNTAAILGRGGSQPHTNLQPFLCLNFIIALFGAYPSRQ